MGDAEVPGWLQSLPLAPEYRPTETEFADPIAFISRVEEEAAGFGICKVIPPIPKPSKKFVFHNLNRSLSKAPELGSVADAGSHKHAAENNAVFTTRHQELGSRRTRLAIHKQVWQSGELYTLEQFEAKSKAFARAHLGGAKGVNPLLVESMFWKAMGEKPVYVEYANDVPGSGFGAPKEPFRCCSYPRRRRRKFKQTGGNMVEQPKVSGVQVLQPDAGLLSGNEWEGSAGWKLSNSPWNLQVIARSPGSLTRFMPDEVPGVTSPMIYIGMLFSWFAWHVEDHELHSLNFLHTGSPKTWYAVPGSYASKFEEVVRMQGYGGQVDRLAAFTLLGEKTTLLSPEVIVESEIPCCRLVQHPGEFVVTFPRAYHVGFSHGFNCGEAANFATPKWLKVAKEAAMRRAAMNYLPMLSHQQLLYMLTISFIPRVPRDFLPGVRSSRLRDRKKEEREILVKKAFLDDLTNEHHLVHLLLVKDPALYVLLWHPDLLPSSSNGSQTFPLSPPCEQSVLPVGECKNALMQCNIKNGASLDTKQDGLIRKDMMHEVPGNAINIPSENISSAENQKDGLHSDDNINVLELGRIQSSFVNDDGYLPCDFDVDSGTLACVACGILGYPFMCVVQPSGKASELFSAACEVADEKRGNLKSAKPSSSCLVDIITEAADSVDLTRSYPLPVTTIDYSEDHIMTPVEHEAHEVRQAGQNGSRRNNAKFDVNEKEPSDQLTKDESRMSANAIHTKGNDSGSTSNGGGDCCHITGVDTMDLKSKWNMSDGLLRPRIFCLQHALEVWELLQCKGGVHVLIICHSDYLKIKAYAVSIAEDIDAQLDCKDVPLKNASQADLDLVYVSIDDEEHEEDGEDWTAKMGLNLRYCVKLRKQSSSNEERLMLGLGGIFSKQGPLSVISGLKWHCRRSRTHHRMIAAGQTRSQAAVNTDKDKPDTRCPSIDPCEKIQVNKSFDSGEVQYKKRRGRPRKNPPTEVVNTIEASVTEDKTCVLAACSSAHSTCAEVLNDGLCKLADSTFPSALGPVDEVHEHHSTLERKEAISSFLVGDSAMTGGSSRCSISAQEVVGTGDHIPSPTTSAEHLQGNDYSSCIGESSANYDVGNSLESECQPSSGLQTITSFDKGGEQETHPEAEIITAVDSAQLQGIGQETQTEAETITAADSAQLQDIRLETQAKAEIITAVDFAQLQDVLTTTKPKEVCNSNILDDQSNRSTTTVEDYELQQGIVENTAWRKQEKSTDADIGMRIEDANSADGKSSARILSSEVSEMHQLPDATKEKDSGINKFDLFQGLKENGLRNTVKLKYERRRKKRQGEVDQIKNDSNPSLSNKRKRDADQISCVQLSSNGFIRSPCEGLRPRSGRGMCEKAFNSTFKDTPKRRGHRRGNDESVVHKDEDKSRGPYQCNLQGCHMSFQTGRELSLHKRNCCTYEGCGKRFISHKYAMRHQCVHDDERPLKCPWKGCNVTFKWAWARTEHIRVHTGERPYKCKASGCGLTFRFVSDFSRHRRKTGHSHS